MLIVGRDAMERFKLTMLLKGVRVARVASTSFSTSTQLLPQLAALHQAGASIIILASEDEWSDPLPHLNFCHFKPIAIRRDIHIFADCRSLFQLWRFFVAHQFDIVHSISPKAGLLTAIAGKLAGVPIRLHTFTGQPWVTRYGFKRGLLKWCDALIARLNTCCYADSLSQRDFLIAQGVGHVNKVKVLGRGSLAGIDLTRFSSERYSVKDKHALRAVLGISVDTQIVLFVGRVSADKGIYELLHAFKNIIFNDDVGKQLPAQNKILLIVGSFEDNIEKSIREEAKSLCGEHVIFTGFTHQPEQYMAIADILCLPSYREGFGTVIIEAAAMGVPAIGSRIYGLIDAIVDGETGLLVDVKNVEQLTDAMASLLENTTLRQTLAKQAKARAIRDFDSQHCGELVVREYDELRQ